MKGRNSNTGKRNELTNKKMRVLKGERVKISHIYRKYTRSSKNGDSLKHCVVYTQSVLHTV